MDCGDKYGGRVRALTALCIWGYRARTRDAARSFKELPCKIEENSNGCTTLQDECLCDGRPKHDANATEGGGVWQAAVGKTREIAFVDLPPICEQRAR
jgi:hypothetical protein